MSSNHPPSSEEFAIEVIDICDPVNNLIGIYARVQGHPKWRVWLPREEAADPEICRRELHRVRFTVMDKTIITSKIREALRHPVSKPTTVAVQQGWHGKSLVFNGKAIRHRDDNKLFVHQRLRRRHHPYSLPKNDRLLGFIDGHAAKSDLLAAACMIAFAQPLLGLMSYRERPVIYLWGDTRTGKSTLATVVNAITRLPSDRALRQFDSTQRAYEEALEYCSGNVAVFDELSAVDDQVLERMLAPFVYTSANGGGKNRSEASSVQNLKWITTAFLTGEKNLDGLDARQRGSGQDARLVTLSVPPAVDGGIWSDKSMSGVERREATEKLAEAVTMYCGSSYLSWLERIVQHQEAIKARFAERVASYQLKLVGEDADNLIRAHAFHFAALAATGDELIMQNVVAWDDDLPFKAISRLYGANRSPSGAKKQDGTVRRAATAILAQIGAGNIQECSANDGKALSAYLEVYKGTKYVMIKKDAEAFQGLTCEKIARALHAAGISVSYGTTVYYQARNPNRRYVRADFNKLCGVAFGEVGP
jgi:hypothetical protein